MRYEGVVYRPPGEWKSYLLQCTIGCSHNACTFCGMYKDKTYRVRPMSDILEDIAMAKAHHGDVKRVFLCDGDAIAIDTPQLLTILHALAQAFPSLERVTTYAGPKSTLSKTPQELRALMEAGLTRAYLGVESGCDQILRQVGKGVGGADMLQAGLRLKEAGMDLWAILLLGLGGKALTAQHIDESIAMMNEMAPRHLSAMTYSPVEGTPLYQQVISGQFQCLTPEDALVETQRLVAGLTVSPLHFTANHPSNYLPISGSLPQDRDAILADIDTVLARETPLKPRHLRQL